MKRPNPHRDAFTLVELLVLLAILVVLLAVLVPSMGRAREITRRALCASNLKQIHNSVTAYAVANRNELIICRGRGVQKAFHPANIHTFRNFPEDAKTDWIEALRSVDLMVGDKVDLGGGYMHYLPSEVWNCPSRDYQSQWELAYPQLVVGYQYFGGIYTWSNPWGNFPSRSPRRLGSSKPTWVLAADSVMKINFEWGGGRDTAYRDLPSHKVRGEAYPEGGNQVHMDGSAQWIPFQEMIYIHTWNTGGSREAYFYQSDLGEFVPPPEAYAVP